MVIMRSSCVHLNVATRQIYEHRWRIVLRTSLSHNNERSMSDKNVRYNNSNTIQVYNTIMFIPDIKHKVLDKQFLPIIGKKGVQKNNLIMVRPQR